LIFAVVAHFPNVRAAYGQAEKFEKNEMGGACSTYGGRERCVQGFGGETCGKETFSKAQALMRG
jgi:hypothetical protein